MIERVIDNISSLYISSYSEVELCKQANYNKLMEAFKSLVNTSKIKFPTVFTVECKIKTYPIQESCLQLSLISSSFSYLVALL